MRPNSSRYEHFFDCLKADVKIAVNTLLMRLRGSHGVGQEHLPMATYHTIW